MNRIQSFSVCLPEGCDAHCPYCISRQTMDTGGYQNKRSINMRIFRKACELARIGGVTTVLFTGKGEPLLFPELIDWYLREMESYNFPIIEVQTNGLRLYRELLDDEDGHKNKFIENLHEEWQECGLTTISISVAHFDKIVNKSVFCPDKEEYIDLLFIVSRLKDMGFMTRVNCTMFRGGIDTPKMVKDFIRYSKECGFDQIVLRPIYSVDDGSEASEWAKKQLLTNSHKQSIREYFEKYTVIRELVHGGVVYSVDGQNVCLSNCMTREPDNREELRQLIYMPDQTVTTEWEHSRAARLF